MQLTLFDTVTLSDLKAFVHVCGLWQNENCYKTVLEDLHGYLVICNLYLYGSPDERQTAHDTIILDVKNHKGKIMSLWKDEHVEFNGYFRSFIRRLESANAFDDYVVIID